MQISELRTFLAIVELGSMVKASKKLNVTQSTVTARLKSLEEGLGQQLINRQKSGATLTGAGERMRRYANTIVELWQQAQKETALPHAVSSICNLACHSDLWPNLGSNLFDEIRQNFSHVALSVWHGSEQDMENWLNDGLVDMALTYRSNANQTQLSLPLANDQLVLVSTQAESPIKFDPLYVFVEAGEEFGKQHAAAYSDADTARISFGNAQLGLDHILKNGGSAYLPDRIASPFLDAGELFRLKEAPVFQRNAYVIANKFAVSHWAWFEELVSTKTQIRHNPRVA